MQEQYRKTLYSSVIYTHNILSVQKGEHRSGRYLLLQYRTATATQVIVKHYNVIKQYNRIECTTTL